MAHSPLTDSEIASVVAHGGLVSEFDLESKLSSCMAANAQTCCLVPHILACGELPPPLPASKESNPAHAAYIGSTLAQGIAEALQTPRVICRTCRCLMRGDAHAVHIQSKTQDGEILGAVMVCQPLALET